MFTESVSNPQVQQALANQQQQQQLIMQQQQQQALAQQGGQQSQQPQAVASRKRANGQPDIRPGPSQGQIVKRTTVKRPKLQEDYQ